MATADFTSVGWVKDGDVTLVTLPCASYAVSCVAVQKPDILYVPAPRKVDM